MKQKADIGLIGLAVMGENLVMNMESKGFTVAVFNRTTEKVDKFVSGRAAGKNIIGCHSLEELVDNLEKPRKVFMMVKAGQAVDDMIEHLLPLLDDGDILIDGGNSHFPDTIRRTAYVESKGKLYIGTGVSGGEEGALKGPSMMPGGSPAAWESVKPIFQSICAKVEDGSPCCDWVGENGAGHFVKMVHNGIEYGDMQLICEAYCGATNVLPPNSDRSDVNEGDIKQIEAVTRILGNELGMKVSKFTAEENIDERNAIKQHFKDGDDLQAIVAIKRLDEGVNIPGIRTAFILASTTNPKEYIQRRGRVLRKSPETGKKFVEIFDFVTLPRPLDEVSGLTQEQMRRDLPLVKNELARVLEFGRLSMNSMEASQLIWEICDCYGLPYDLNDDEKEDPYGDSEVRP